MKTRIAPTPSGYLHQGNALSFLLTQKIAKEYDASILLRIDDLDHARYRKEYLEDIFTTLKWLQIEWNEGPENLEEFESAWSQTTRTDDYHALINRLSVIPGAVFACTCSRTDMQGNAIYPGTCIQKNLPLDTPDSALRVLVPQVTAVEWNEFNSRERHKFDLSSNLGCFIIRRRDGIPAYHIASLSDDLKFGINLVVRGEDLMPSTAAQLFLARLLGETFFSNAGFIHHPLIKSQTGQKLSKSQKAAPFRAVIDSGINLKEWIRSISNPFKSLLQ